VTDPSRVPKNESGTLQYGGSFRVRLNGTENDVVVLELIGELDVVSMARFEQLIADLLSGNPKELIFDVTQTQFISVQGYDAMGRCSPGVDVTVRARTDVAGTILTMYGHDRVVTVVG
jgi:hypothetical protein